MPSTLTPKATESDPWAAAWRTLGVGVLLVAAGVAGAAYAWFPAPPHSTAAPANGWPARWLSAGVGCFGVVVAVAGMAALRGVARRPLRRSARAAFALTLVCWCAWLVSQFPR